MSTRGGARPGAGRPRGSKNTTPRERGPETKRIWLRLHPHVMEAIERSAEANGTTPNQAATNALDRTWRCPCKDCRQRRKEYAALDNET